MVIWGTLSLIFTLAFDCISKLVETVSPRAAHQCSAVVPLCNESDGVLLEKQNLFCAAPFRQKLHTSAWALTSTFPARKIFEIACDFPSDAAKWRAVQPSRDMFCSQATTSTQTKSGNGKTNRQTNGETIIFEIYIFILSQSCHNQWFSPRGCF